jgi:uncharacterized membrane protein
MIYATQLLHICHRRGSAAWFAHFLRPATMLEPPQRIRLMHGALQRFFAAVLVSIVIVLATGLWMIGRVAKESVQAGLSFNMPLDWTLMTTLGIVMMVIFGHIRFALFKRLSKAVATSDWPSGGAVLVSIRTWVSINLAIGLAIIVITLLMA